MDLKYAELIAQSVAGQPVSINFKRKELSKFGRVTIASADTDTDVALWANSIDAAVSSDDSDAGQITIEGHTIDASGLLTFQVQTITLEGNTPVSLTTALARVTRIYRTPGTFASPATPLAGTVAVYDSTVASSAPSGVPSEDTAVHCLIAAGDQQSEKGATSISALDCWLIHNFDVSIEKEGGGQATVTAWVEWRGIGGVWRPLGGVRVSLRSGAQHTQQLSVEPCAAVPPNSDIRIRANSTNTSTVVYATLRGPLAKLI